MATYVVTGGTGFLGLHLTGKLLEQGHMVYTVVRPASKHLTAIPSHPRCKLIRADAGDVETWRAAIPRADVFFHLAWSGAGMEGRADYAVQEKNIKDSLACLRVAAELGTQRFLFFGSQAEYGLQTSAVEESFPCAPVTEYGKAKLEFYRQAQPLARSLGIGYTHLRIFSVYGPGDHPWTLVNTCLDGFLNGREVALSSCEQPWNFLYIDDLVQAVLALCDTPVEQTGCAINLAGDETRPLREYVDTIWRLCDNKGTPLFGARGDQLERPYGIMPVNRKLHQLTGWTQRVSFEAGIREMISSRRKEEIV